MAAYAALVSVMHIIEQIRHHPKPPISLDKTQVESLTEKVTFLQEFLEGYSHVSGYRKEADPLENRIADAAYAAEDVIESHIVDQILPPSTSRGQEISSVDLFEGLQKVIEDMGLMQKEAIEIKEKMGFRHLQRLPTPNVSLRSSSNMAMVGFGDALIEVMGELTRGQLDRHIISIVGMGGIGKTTLARNIYQDQVVAQHFHILVWVTISQDYSISEILSQLLQGVGGGSIQMDEHKLGENLYKELSGRRYLIVLDDIWDIQVWDKLRRFFPDNRNGSRIVITTRISDFQATGSYVVKMGFLDEDQSWSLFCKIVFGEEGCPVEMEEMEEIGKKIVENCGGLPLSIVVVAGLLAKSKYTQEYWENIAENLNSIVNLEDDERCLKILHLSYNQLPVNLKPCFLYMGVFPEDKKIRVSKLIHLWVVEGFLKPINGKSLEVIADEYLKELINRNLILVHELGCIGNIKYCNIHDLLRDLCLKEAQKQRFYGVIRKNGLDFPQERRVVIPKSTSEEKVLNALQSMSHVRSLICEFDGVLPFLNFRLLRLVSYTFFHYTYTLESMLHLVNSRYLVLSAPPSCKLPSSVHRLWNLHTIVIKTREITAPSEIWNMSQLRHFVSESGIYLPSPPGRKNDIVLENLQVLGRIINFQCCDEVVRRIPNIKKLKVYYDRSFEKRCPSNLGNLGNLHKLESLRCLSFLDNHITFPHSLKKLTMSIGQGGSVYWEDMLESIGALPLLEKLIFMFGCFKGQTWETVEGQFPSLKFLKIVDCDGLKCWETESSHFPRLEHLVLVLLEELEEIPLDIGEIPKLKSIKLLECTNSVAISAKDIVVEQEDSYGVVSLQVQVRAKDFEQKEELQMWAGPNFQFI